jgi:hypothetical protein
MKFRFAATAAVTALLFGGAIAFAEDEKAPEAPSSARVLVFGDGAARFNVERDVSAGRMVFRVSDPSVKIENPPVIVTTTSSGPREVVLTPLAGEPGAWVWTDEVVKAETFDGTMRVVVAGRTYNSPLTTVWTTDAAPEGGARPARIVARYGGRILALPDCGASVEVVQDMATGALTIYSNEDVVITEAPVITVTESEGPSTVTLTRVSGKDGVWTSTHKTFKTSLTSARIRLLVNGKACEAPLTFGSSRGGQLVTVAGGPTMEVVHDPKAGYYTFYAVDDTINGKAYTIENPTVVYGDRTYTLTRVEGEPRAWRLIGLDTAGSTARDAQLNMTLFGKTLSTRLGLSGLGVGVK